MSLLTRKHPADGLNGFRDQAMLAARQAVPVARNATSAAAQQAVPLARSAGTSMKQGVDGTVAWATPYVGAARHWAAPRLEQSAVALNENIAPMIADALISAARKIDYVPPRQRRISRNGLFVGSMVLLAAGAAAAFIAMQRQGGDGDGDDRYGTAMPTGESADGEADRAGPTDMPGAEGNGQSTIV